MMVACKIKECKNNVCGRCNNNILIMDEKGRCPWGSKEAEELEEKLPLNEKALKINKWRLAHQKCEYCKYFGINPSIDMWYYIIYPYCNAKEKYTKSHKGKHCKVFELKEYRE